MNWGKPAAFGLQSCCWLYCCKRKMLKRNWNWRNYRLFCHIFVIGEISIGEGVDPLPPSPRLRLCSKWGKQKRSSQILREVSGVFQRNFNCSKNSAVLEPRTGQFSRTWGFEAKAKDLKLRGQELQNVFSRTPPLRNDVIKIFRNEGLFIGERYRKLENQKPGLGWHVTWILLEGKDWNLSLFN